jgi:exopolysaccharide production protein ExoY
MRPDLLAEGVFPQEKAERVQRFPSSAQTGVAGAAKSALDRIGALLLVLLFLPFLAVVVLAIWAEDRGPAIFKHRRIGKNGRPFYCLKFRSMYQDADVRLAELLKNDQDAANEWFATQKLRVDPRVTRVGKFLRSTSLDELPQLFNVLRGDMSLVGPRPIVEAELARYGEAAPFYLSVQPGLTGLWQISGRSNLAYDERVALDRLYVTGWSLGKDAEILLKTPMAVLARKGAI